MPTLHLTNLIIKKLADKNSKDYYLIMNNYNNQEVFFCFEWALKKGWEDLEHNWENIHEVEIEYIEKENNRQTYKRVISLAVSYSESEAWEVF